MHENEEREDLSLLVKRQAAMQPITIQVTDDQLTAIRAAWNEGDPASPAQITFTVKDKPVAELAVAGYRYAGNTCCV